MDPAQLLTGPLSVMVRYWGDLLAAAVNDGWKWYMLYSLKKADIYRIEFTRRVWMLELLVPIIVSHNRFLKMELMWKTLPL